MEIEILLFIAYSLGTIVGLFISANFIKDHENRLLDTLIEEGFLKHRFDKEGNVVIQKWNSPKE